MDDGSLDSKKLESNVPLQDAPEVQVYNRDSHTVSRKNIDPDALKILYRLIRHDHKAYLVGGGVRDLLLGKTPKDFDIATDATPRKIKSLFRNCRIIGRRFKLAHIYFRNRKIIEVSTFRDLSSPIDLNDDVEKENLIVTRDNKYGSEATDAFRRDITINALFYDLSTFSIRDYVGGMEDLDAGLVRVIGDPDVRFVEDPVRLLRVVRHAGRAGFSIEDNCRESLIKNHKLITHSSPVRLYEEFKKDLVCGYTAEIFRLSYEHKLLQHLLPEMKQVQGNLLENGHPFSDCLSQIDNAVRGGNEVTITAILAALALFLRNPEHNLDQIRETFSSPKLLRENLSECYVGLSVPRKERERIEDTLLLWQNIDHSDFEKLQPNSLARRRHIEDAYWVFRFFGFDLDSELMQILDTARRNRARSQEDRGSRGRGRRGKSQKGKRAHERGNSQRRGPFRTRQGDTRRNPSEKSRGGPQRGRKKSDDR